MNTLQPGNPRLFAAIRQLTARGGYDWAERHGLRDAVTFPGGSIMHTPCA